MTSISDIKEHVLNRIVTKDINTYPFYNLYVEDRYYYFSLLNFPGNLFIIIVSKIFLLNSF